MKWVNLIAILMLILFLVGCQNEVAETVPISTLPPTFTPVTSTPEPTSSSISLSDEEIIEAAIIALNFENDPDMTALADKRCRDQEAYSRGAIKYLGWDSALLEKINMGILGGGIHTLEASECYDLESVINKLTEWRDQKNEWYPHPSSRVGLGYYKGFLCLVFWWPW
jgi:hypothetical protein